jgi:enoyl-CoA hydratase/carnithine racemase
VLAADEDLLTFEARDGIGILTLRRPPANAFSSEMYRRLSRLAAAIAEDEAVRVVILTAEGSRIFSGGADVKELATLDGAGRAAFFEVSGLARRTFAAIPVPVIAAINGACAGAGVAYPARCDYRIAAEHAQFSMPEIDRGSVAGGGVDLMPLGVPSGRLRMMLYTGRKYAAHEALAMHLVDEVVPFERLMEVAMERASDIAAKPRHALMQMKRAITEMSYNPVWGEEGYEKTQRMSVALIERADAQEGISAFLDKRKPQY